MAKKTAPPSYGVRKRFGRSVKDATAPIIMPLTKHDITSAATKRLGYDVDEHENFSECVLATCISKAAGANVLIMRKHAYVALPDDQWTLRYEVDRASTELIHLNDEGRFNEIPPNVSIKLRPPSPRRQLATQRANAKKKNNYKATRGSGRKQSPVDPYHGVWRHGMNAPDLPAS